MGPKGCMACWNYCGKNWIRCWATAARPMYSISNHDWSRCRMAGGTAPCIRRHIGVRTSTRVPHGPLGSDAPWRLWNTVKRSVVTTGFALLALTTVWHDLSLRFTNGARTEEKLMAYGIG